MQRLCNVFDYLNKKSKERYEELLHLQFVKFIQSFKLVEKCEKSKLTKNTMQKNVKQQYKAIKNVTKS